jgi:hypothetical protein
MKSTAIIGTAIGAGCLFALMPGLSAQEDQMIRHRPPRAQMSPATSSASAGAPATAVYPQRFRSPSVIPPPQRISSPLPASTPRFRKSLQHEPEVAGRTSRPGNTVPNRSGSQQAEITALKPGSTSGNTSPRRRSKKLHGKSSDRAHTTTSPSPSGSPTERDNHNNERQSDKHEGERALVSPSRISPTAPAAAIRTPEGAPIMPPPVTAAPAQRPGPIAGQQAPSRSQRAILNDLSEDERAKLHSAHQNALQHNPNLAESRARYLNARKEFREKLRDALLKADPSVQPILEKIRRNQPEDR